jgi:predicted Zn-ribbon and HTH transcriptional regulator
MRYLGSQYLGGIYLRTHTEQPPRAGMAKVQVWAWKCERCEHEWVPRGAQPPTVCPKCKSPYWDRPRQAPKSP